MPQSEWLRDKRLVYCTIDNTEGSLAMRRAAPQINLFTVRVEACNGKASDAEAEAIAERIADFLNASALPTNREGRGDTGLEAADENALHNIFFSLTLINRFRAGRKLGVLTMEEIEAASNREQLAAQVLIRAKEQGKLGQLRALLTAAPTPSEKGKTDEG
jgi:hypothetical protein